MPADPVLWQVLGRVKATLEAIVAGANYHITPHAVYIVRTFEDGRLYNPALGNLGGGFPATIIGIRRFDVNTQRHSSGDATSGDRCESVADIGILVSQYHNPSSPDDEPTEAKIIEQLRADVIRAMAFVDPGLGASVEADDVLANGGLDDSVVEDVPDGWIACGMTFRVRWQFFSSRP